MKGAAVSGEPVVQTVFCGLRLFNRRPSKAADSKAGLRLFPDFELQTLG
jgi:hypothetical protein